MGQSGATDRCMVIKFPATANRRHVLCGRGLVDGLCSEHGDGRGLPKAADDKGSVNEQIRKLTSRGRSG